MFTLHCAIDDQDEYLPPAARSSLLSVKRFINAGRASQLADAKGPDHPGDRPEARQDNSCLSKKSASHRL